MLKNIYKLLALGGLIYIITFYLSNYYLDPYSWAAWWVANFFHLVGGFYAFFLTRAFFLYNTVDRPDSNISPPVILAIFLGGVLTIGLFWEWYEFIVDRYSVLVLEENSMMTYADTMGDLLFDALGGIMALFYLLKSGLFRKGNYKS